MKNLITYLKTLWGAWGNLQSSDVSLDRRLTVGSPSGLEAKLQVNTFVRFAATLVLVLTLGVGSVWGDTQSFDKNDFSSATSSKTPITVTFSSAPTINNQQIRFSSGTTVRFQSSSGNITSIAVATNSSNPYIKDMGKTVTSGTWSGSGTSYTWTGNTTDITMTAGAACRITTITVTYTAAASCTTKPTVGSDLTSVSATVNSITATVPISAIGGCNITENGLVYSTSNTTPTVGGTNCTKVTTTACGSTAANKTVTISDLTCGTSYYVRGYATNNAGTSYTNVKTQSTSACPKYTVTLKDDETELTQASAGATVTLPTRTGCSGYTFAGWTKSWTSAQSSWTTTAPTIIEAGSYTPEGNENLYPVYTKTESGGTATATITTSNFTNLGSNNYGSGTERTGTVGTISLGGHYITGNSTNIQCQANNANIYNKTAFPGKITRVVLNQTGTVAFSLYVGTEQLMSSSNTSTGQTPSGTKITDVASANTMTWDVTGNYTYFDIKKGGSAGYISSIVVTYSSSTTSYISVPNCCIPLGSVNGSVSRTTPTTATLTWETVTGAEKYQVKIPGSTSHNDWTDATSGVEVTGLTCGTAYTAYFRAIDTDDSHCAEGPESTESVPASSWTVTSTGITHATVSPAIQGTTCSGFSTTVTAISGYVLPSTITVTNADKTWNSSTGALTISNVTGNVEITITCVAESCTGQYCISSYDAGGNGMTCFTGNSTYRTISDYVIPATNQDDRNLDLWVGYSGAWVDDHSENWYFRWIPLKELAGGCGMRLSVAPQAVGTLTINTGSSNANYELTFDPNGYGFVYGSGDSWSNRAFVQQTDPNVWRTDILALTTTEIGKNYYVGLAKSGGGYVKTLDYDYNDANEHIWGPSYEGTISGMGVANGVNGSSEVTFRDGGLNNGDDGMRGFYEIWSNNCNRNFYCHFVPVHRIVYHANWPVSGSPADTYSVDVSVEETNSSIELASAPSAPTGYHFVGWYDAASGGDEVTGTQTISAGTSADVELYAHWSNQTAITLSKNGGSENGSATATFGSNTLAAFTPVTRNSTTYRLLGYSKSGTPSEIVIDKDGHLVANTTYTDASGNWISTAAEVTLVAQWQAGHTITWMANGTTYETTFVDAGNTLVLPGSTPTSCDAGDTDTYLTFIGWYSTAAGTNSAPTASIGSCGTQATTSIVPDANQTYYAVWGNGALEAGEVKEVTLDFTTNTNWSFPTDYTTTSDSYTSGGHTITMGYGTAGDGWKFSSNYLIYGKTGCYLQLPAFTFVVSKINVTTTTGMSTSTTYNIYSGANEASSAYTGRAGSGHDFVISDDYDDLGTIYQLKVTNAYNIQVTTIDVYSSSSAATGFISSCCGSAAVVTVTPDDDELELNIDGEATTSVSVSQTGAASGRYYPPTVTPAATGSTDWAGSYKENDYSVNFTATATGTYTIKAPFRESGYSCDKTGSAIITVAANPILTASVANLTVNGVCDDNGTPQTFTLNSRYLPDAHKTLTITAATTSGSGAYKVSTDGSSYSTSVNVTGGVGSKATQTIYVRYEGAADETGSLIGSVTISNNNDVSTSVALSGTCSCGTYVKLTPANATSTHILAPNGQWTRAQGAIAIRANYLNSAAENVNIKLTSSNNKFKFTTGTSAGSATFESGKVVTASNNSWDGTVYIVYTPTSYNASESTTITAEVITFGGTTVHASTTTTVYGRSFPETFVLAVNTGSSWVAVPADMIPPYGGSGNQCSTGVGTHDPYPITVNDNANPTSASNVPARAIYKGASRNTPTSAPWTVQMESNSQTGYYLWGSKNATTIADENFATGERQKWYAESSDLVTFNFHLDDSIRTAGARLGYSGSAIGQYTSAASSYKYDFRILPISSTCAYFINPVLTLDAYDGTTATVSIPYDGTTNYMISTDNKANWTAITGTIDCKKLTFSLPLATYRGTNVWLKAAGEVCQGDATSVSALHIPAPVITDPGAQHLYGVINVATSESFAVTGTDMYGTISVTSSNPAITANYSEGNITVNMASTAVAGDYVTTLTLSSVGAANVTVDVTITIRDLAEMTFSIEDLHNGKICANDLTYDAKFYVYLNGGSAVYRAADGSSLVNATSQISSCVFIRDLSINGDDNQTGFNGYSVTSGIASFYIPTTNLVPGHTYRISYYNNLANSGTGLFNSSRLGFADAHVDFVYSLDCTAPTAMIPCITSPTSVVANWDDFDCTAPNTLQLNVFRHNDTEHANYNLTNASGSVAINDYSHRGDAKWFTGGQTNSKGSTGYPMLSTNNANKLYSPTFANWWSSITADDEVTITFRGYNNRSDAVDFTVNIYVIANGNVAASGQAPTTFKSVKIDGVNCGNGVAKQVKLEHGQKYTEVSFTMKGVIGTDRFYINNTYSSNACIITSMSMASVSRDYVTGYNHKNVDGTSQEVTGLTVNTTYYTTMNCGSKESPEVAFHTWTSGSSYVKFYEDAGHTTEIEALDKIEVLGGQTTHVYMDGQKVPGCEVVPTVSSGYGLEDHTTYDPATGALGGYIDLTLTNPAITSGTLTITDGTGSTTTREIKSSDCPTDFETLALPATSITNNGATANWNSSADFEGVTEGTLYLYRDGVVDAEYITNESFETGDLTGWNFLNVGAIYACDAYEVRNSNAHSGTHALYASDEGSIEAALGYTTVIYGNPVTLPAGTYEMTSWVKVPVYSGYSDKHSYFKQGLAGCTLIGSSNETCYALSPDYTNIQSNNTYVQITDVFVLENPIKALPFVGHRADVGYTFHPFYLDDVSLKRISAPNAEEPDKVFPIADMSAVNSQALGTLSGNTQYSYLLKNENGCPSNTITFKTLPADGPTISAEDIEISAPAGSSATGVIVVQVWDATAEISVSKGVASGSDQITLSNTTVPQEGGTIRVLFTPNTDPGSTGTCPVILNTRGLAEPVTVNINWAVTAGEDTDKPIIEVTEISNEELTIEHNVDADSVRIVMNREKTQDEIELNVGDEIFFSKYYEAYSHKKLWAIFNPTNDTISLAGMEVWRSSSKYDGWHSDVMDLSEMGYIKPGWICPNEEIVVYTTNQVGTCEQNTVGLDVMSTWWQGGTSSDMPLSFSGDDALLLVRNTSAVSAARHNALPTTSAKTGEAISWPDPISNARGEWYMLDIIGGRTDGGSPSGKNVQTAWHWYNSKTGEYEDGDDKGWVGYGKDMNGKSDYNTSSEHPGYLLSTNRCLLVRLKNVSSGANAINSNIENMVTLNTEWQGSHVPTEGDQAAVSCENFSFVGGYDYAGFYNAWTEIGDYEVGAERNPDGSFTVEMDVPEYYCKTIHIEVMSIDTINGVLSENVHAYEDYKVPIVVDADKLTTAELFEFGGDTCATCDVVIRDEATLSHVSGGVDQFRNMTVYPGASFDNSAKQGFLLDGLLMEAKNDEVGYAIINNNGSTIAAGNIVHVKRIDDQYWYPFSLPYDCDISAIRQQNGKSMGEYWEDWGIKYYDGAARQAAGESSAPGTSSKFWKQMPVSGTLKANEAYIIGLFTTDWAGQFKSVYFPPKTTKEYTEAGDDAKMTDVYNWAEGLASEKRHHGWNFVGSPYISMFGSSEEGHGLNNPTNLILGKINETSGEYEDLGYVYVSVPDGAASKTYTQAKASAITIEPFKGYFIQTVDPDNGTDNTLNLTYQKADRMLSQAPARKATAQKQRVEVDLKAEGNGQSDIAGIIVDEKYTADYEIGGDMTKMYAAATKPQLYFLGQDNEKMAYIAIPDANAEDIPMELYAPKAGQYIISLNKRSSRTDGAESVELLYNGNVMTNLLIDSCTINANNKGVISGYSVRIRRTAQVITSMDLINGEHVTVITNNGQMSITNLPGDAKVFVYDMTGRLMSTGNADGESVVNIDAPQQGVYNVVVQSAAGKTAIRTIVR